MKALRFLLALCVCLPATSSAQTRVDSAQVHRLDAIVVTAERASTSVLRSVSAVTRLERSQLRTRPLRNLADAVQQAAGIAFVDFDGNFADPQAIVRGFYGGGEADYLLLLVDGRPLNALETGRINWDAVPVSAIESIEVVRGPASAAWGDAALGGVVNVTTRAPLSGRWRASLRGGAFGALNGAAGYHAARGGKSVSAYADVMRSDGFRAHAERTTGTTGVTLAKSNGLSLSALGEWRTFDEPGALTAAELAAGRAASSPFHRFDAVNEALYRVTLERRTGTHGQGLHAALNADIHESDRIRTIRLSPEFADTKNRVLSTRRVNGSAQWDGALGRNGSLMLGGDASYGRISSDYYNVNTGPLEAYAGTAERGDLDAGASGNRGAAAGFFRYALQATPALLLTGSGRLDWLRDAFETDDTRDDPPDPRSHTVFSPRAGVNLRYLESAAQRGHLYASIGRSFKAPTPDQLYDRRRLPVPFPPFAITFANPDLEPQHGTNYEAGLYHAATLGEAISADLSLAAYQLDLRDEIDFDVQTFSYKNLGRSRHRGIEAGVNLYAPQTVRAFGNYTLQAATSRIGDNAGNALKAIPRHTITAGVGAGPDDGLSGSLRTTTAREIFLDDANTLKLPDWTRWDARLTYRWRELRLSLDVFNLLDARYSTTGFPDAATGEVYYYPAAGRSLQIGLTRGG